jgi:hypothetical protein
MRLANILILVGLAAWPAALRAQHPDKLVGMTREQIASCAAWPARETRTDAVEILTFLAQDAKSGEGTSHPMAGVHLRYCTVTLTLRAGSVERVEYGTRSRSMMISGDQCAYAVDRCVASR